VVCWFVNFGQKGEFICVKNCFFFLRVFGYVEIDLCSMMCDCVIFVYFGNICNCNLAQIEVTGGWVVF
jgi:hypothetical protein